MTTSSRLLLAAIQSVASTRSSSRPKTRPASTARRSCPYPPQPEEPVVQQLAHNWRTSAVAIDPTGR